MKVSTKEPEQDEQMTVNKKESENVEKESEQEREFRLVYDILKNQRIQKWDDMRLTDLNKCKDKLQQIYKKFQELQKHEKNVKRIMKRSEGTMLKRLQRKPFSL